MSSGKIRLFYAVWPDAATRLALQQWQQHVRGRLVAPANLHLTLAFLGSQPPGLLTELIHILSELAAPPLPIHLDHLGSFRNGGIVWAGGDFPNRLLSLHAELTQRLEEKGVGFDKRLPYRPHLTLARDAGIRRDIPVQPRPIEWQADHLALVQSLTLGSGVHYEIVASHRLRDDSHSA